MTATERTARALAAALDRDDFAAARALLAPDCVYETGRETLCGPDAILASYADASRWARAVFDRVRYESGIEAVRDRVATVRYLDDLEKNGLAHRHACLQEITVGDDGRVVRIVHRDLPGEPGALQRYLRRCGLER